MKNQRLQVLSVGASLLVAGSAFAKDQGLQCTVQSAGLSPDLLANDIAMPMAATHSQLDAAIKSASSSDSMGQLMKRTSGVAEIDSYSCPEGLKMALM